MTLDAPLAEAARTALEAHVVRLEKKLGAACRGDDADAVHDARVSIRRARAVLEMLGGDPWRRGRTRLFRSGLQALARDLGEVRDADVFLDASSATVASDADLHRVRRRRKRALRRLAKRRDLESTRRLLHRLRRFATTPGEGNEPLRAELAPRVRDRAASMLWRKYEAVREHERGLENAKPEALHRLRVDAKRLRYALELFAPALATGTAELLAQVVEVQDRLGVLHDAELAATHTARDAGAPERADAARRIDSLRREALTAVEPVLSAGFAQRLAALLTAF